MSKNIGLRALAVLISVVLVTSAIPVLIVSVSPVGDASAQEGLYVKVGWMQKFQNWNPLNIAFVSDWVAIFLVYDSLFQYNEDLSAVENHLATGSYYEYGPAGNMSFYVNISENAYFRNAKDPLDTSHKLTAEDVKFTIEFIQDNPGGSWDYYVLNITGVNVTKPYQVKIDTAYPKATFYDDFVWVPILPKYEWEGTSNPLSSLSPMDMLGSGPFYLADYSHNQWYTFNVAPNYHGTTDYGEERDFDFEGITYTIYSNIDGLRLAVENGEQDVVEVTGAQTQTWNDLGAGMPHIIKQVTTELGIYDICINNIPVEMRTKTYGNGNLILLDDTVRKAIGMTLDKVTLSEEYFDHRATIADSVLNPGFWHADLASYTEVLPFNPAWAKENLTAAGYADTNSDDILEVTEDTVAYTEYDVAVGTPLEFRLRVPDSDPAYATIGEAWVGWAEDAGIRFNFEVLPEMIVTNFDWYQAEFDVWVWSWYWGPEPLSNLAVWRTSEVTVGGDNCAGPITDDWYWVDQEEGLARCTFDDVFDQAMRTIDVNERKDLVDQLQVMIYDSYTEFPPLHPNGLYAMSEANFVNWGNWTTNLGLTIISDMLWLWYNLEPASSNMNPVFDTPLNPAYEVEVDQPALFTIGVSDVEGDPITVTWCWGDDTDNVTQTLEENTDVEQTVSQSHTYADEGDYTLIVTIIDDQHTIANGDTSVVSVVSETNLGPDIGSMTADPATAYVGEDVEWSATAKDLEQGIDGEGLLFTWDWDDESPYSVDLIFPVENDTYVYSNLTHSWSTSGTYDVTVNVWDGYDEDTNTMHNVSLTKVYKVIDNTEPEILNVSSISGLEGVAVPCIATAVDADPDTLTFTWDWDDGTYLVTTADTSDAPGEPVRSVVYHTWDSPGTYAVTVYVNDSFEAADHNVSDSVDAEILASSEDAPPGSISLIVSPYPSYTGEELTLNLSAYDANGDELTVTVEFGDGESAVATIAGGTADVVYVELSHAYTDAGTYTVTVYVDDGTTNVTETFSLEVQEPAENREPVLTLQSDYSFYLGVDKEIRPGEVYDPDGDPLEVWYDWGDGSPLTKGDEDDGYAGNHTYLEAKTFTLTVYADDGQEHNVTDDAQVNVLELNRRPVVVGVVKVPTKSSYEIAETITFNVTVYDKEGDDVELIIDFGDNTNQTLTITDLAPSTNRTVSFTHEYEEAGVYSVVATAKDGQIHADPNWLTSSTSVNVESEDKGLSTLVIAGIALALIIIVAVVAMLLMRRKKGGAEESGGMEGMAPPESGEQAPPPPT